MKSFLDEYSLDDACDDIVHLDIHENKYDFFAFTEVVVKYTRLQLRKKYGTDILTIGERKGIAEYLREILLKHPTVDNDMALIVAAHALELEVVVYLKNRGSDVNPDRG